MPSTLPISRLIPVSITLASNPAQAQSLNTMLVLGNSAVIDTVTRLRAYTSLTQVGGDFLTTSPEYLSAKDWFAQSPQPNQLLIGRWAQTAASGQLLGGPLTPTNSLVATWTAITNGSFKVTVDGGSQQSLTAMNFSAVTNLNGVATIIGAVLTGATIKYNSVFNRFEITSNTTGATSTISFLVAGASGTDISGLLAGLSTSPGVIQANGIAAETALSAVTLFDTNFGQQWYALTMPTAVDADHQAVAGFIEAATNKHFYGITSSSAGILSSSSTTDIAFLIQAAGYNKTAVLYSSQDPYAMASVLGRILTTNYAGSNTVITLFFKQLPGVTPEVLNTTQITALEAKNCNVYVLYNNNVPILENGTVGSGQFIDTIIGADALGVNVQNDLFNLQLQTQTKIPQTDAGVHLLTTTVENTCIRFVTNGFLGPGIWTSAGFGTLQQNQNLPKGYYVFAAPISQQPTAQRALRLSPLIQVAAKTAGAVHDIQVSVVVNQ